MDRDEIMTIGQFCKKFKFITEAGLRWKLFIDANFRAQCSRKLGKRVYILAEEVVKYIKSQKGAIAAEYGYDADLKTRISTQKKEKNEKTTNS